MLIINGTEICYMVGADGHKDRPCTQTLTGKTLFHLNILDAPHASRQRVEDDLGRLFLAKKISAQ